MFELGIVHARSIEEPVGTDEGERRITSNGIFYRQSWFASRGLYMGGRIDASCVRGAWDKQGVDIVVGLQTGYRIARWLNISVDAVAAEPSFDDGMRPVDLRRVLTVSYCTARKPGSTCAKDPALGR